MKKILFIIKLFQTLLFIFIIIYLGIYTYAFITPKKPIYTTDNIIFYDKDENNIFNELKENDYVYLNEISNDVKNAIVSIEDKNFYKHNGFDYLRILKAIFINIKNKKILQGASTISQQYIKNLYLSFDKTWKRKIEEAYLTIELETHYNKNEILEGYLNTIDFGGGNYGIKQASNYYFNKDPNELSIEEATILVGIPKNPSYYNPITNYKNAKNRQKEVLYSMYKNNYISKKDINKIHNKEIAFYGKYNKIELSSVNYYKDAVLNEMSNIKEIPKSLLEIKNINIYTNYDKDVQKELENSVDINSKDTDLQIASIIVEPQTGKIVSLIGGKDYSKSEYNRAVYSKRQVGSTIKPFLYYIALENGFNASSKFLSEKTTFNLGNETYSPKNAGNIYANKEISLLAAIAYSDNIYALKTHLFLGTDKLSKFLNKLNVKANIQEVASSALGTSEINMIDYANAYITLANEGKHETPHLIEKITDDSGNILYEYNYKNEDILNNSYVYILNNLLTNTYNYKMVKYTSPTLLSIANDLDSKYAIKSGSTATDYWTIGYNKDYLMMVWAGNDNNENIQSKDSKVTKKIFANTITNLPNNTKQWYKKPDNVTLNTINPITGEYDKNGIPCYYENGTEPTFKDFNLLNNISN